MRSLLIFAAGDAEPIGGADALIVDSAPPSPQAAALYLRLPPLDDPGALVALKAVAASRPRGVALPLAGAADLQRLGARLAVEEARLGLEDGSFRVLAFAVESPQAIFGLPSYRGASNRLEALVVSVAPLAAALGSRTIRRDAGPLRLARDLTLIAARAAGVWAIDAPYDGDDDGLRAVAEAAHADGFDGMAALSAAQVAVINEVFG